MLIIQNFVLIISIPLIYSVAIPSSSTAAIISYIHSVRDITEVP